MKKILFWGGGIIFLTIVGAGVYLALTRSNTLVVTDDQGVLVDGGQKEGVVAPPQEVRCVVSGCSGQLCIDEKNVESRGVTNCIWQEEFGCYKEARCEPQSDGQCGWTSTSELNTCIDAVRSNPKQPQAPVDPGIKLESVTETQSTAQESSVDTSPNMIVVSNLVSWGFALSEARSVDAIILHSSYNALEGDKYDVSAIINIYKRYSVSPHYVIDREGKIYQLVEEKNVAYHAGESRLPDGETNVNSVSIGIEMINDDKGDTYTNKQYEAVDKLIADIKKRYAIRYVLGHSDIAPGRKTDPWGLDWGKIKK